MLDFDFDLIERAGDLVADDDSDTLAADLLERRTGKLNLGAAAATTTVAVYSLDAAADEPAENPLADHTPEELITEIRAGNDAAGPELLDRFGGLLHMVALEYAPDYSQVEDLEQECRIHLLKQLGRYDESRPLKPWLMTVVRNCARNYRRSANRWRLSSLPETMQPPEAGDAPLSEALHDQELVERLRGCVDELPLIYRQVVERRYFREDSCDAIASELEIPVGTVKNRLFRARQMLATQLEPHVN